jgi:hypothetical protein
MDQPLTELERLRADLTTNVPAGRLRLRNLRHQLAP